MPYFVASVVVNFALLGGAIVLLYLQPDWLKSYPYIAKQLALVRDLTLAALVGLPAISFLRSARRARMVANAVLASDEQFKPLRAILEEQCRALGMAAVPELFITDRVTPPFSQAGSDWNHDYIVLGEAALETDLAQSHDIAEYFIGYELGRIRLGHTQLWNELLLKYIEVIPYLGNPLRHARTYSRDRYGAVLSGGRVNALLLYAANRRLLADLDADDYIRHALGVRGFWVTLAALQDSMPPLAFRLQELHKRSMTLQGGIEPRPKETD